MGAPRRDDLEPSSTLLHCFLAEGACGGVGLLGSSFVVDSFAASPASSSSEASGQRPTPPRPASS